MTECSNNYILERLKQARKDLGLTQSEFAEKLGMTQQSYNLIENGKTKLSDKHIKPICSIFCINEEWLRTGMRQEFINSHKMQELLDYAKKLDASNVEFLADFAKRLFDKQVEDYDPDD